MKTTGIILIVIGALAVLLNALIAPTFDYTDYTHTEGDAYQAGYYIGLFAPAIIGLLLIITGIVLARKADRRVKERGTGFNV